MSTWSNVEVQLIVADYFRMLSLELQRKPYNKTEHRRNLMLLLNDRSESSIEFKHQNISAVLVRLGQPYIKGYLPRFNIQQLLFESVVEYLNQHQEFELLFKNFADVKTTLVSNHVNFEKWLVDTPKLGSNESVNIVSEPDLIYRNPIKTNYLEREQRNVQLGLMGEELVLRYEQWSLKNLGMDNLASRIEWISKTDDGAGFDILSFNPDGSDKYIEVKTTKLGKETPFFFSKNELNFSMRNSSDYHLFRLFNADSDVKMFNKCGSLKTVCHSEPISYKGWF